MAKTDINAQIQKHYDGDETCIDPVQRSLSGVPTKFAKFSPGFMSDGYDDQEQTERDCKILYGMIDQLNKTTVQASAAIDEALAVVDASNKRIEVMERRATEDKVMP